MRVGVFFPDYNSDHCRTLFDVAAGARACGAEVDCLDARKFKPGYDYAVIFGMYKKSFEKTLPKKTLIEHYRPLGKLIVVESAFVHRGDYFQLGLNGQAGEADFKNDGVPGDRWRKLRLAYPRLRHKPTGTVVVCGQVPWDVQVQNTNHNTWCKATVDWFQARNVPVAFRPHPRMVNHPRENYGVPLLRQDRRSFSDTAKDARAFVTWNSTSAVDALLHGVPVVTFDPGSIAWGITQHDYADAVTPTWPDNVEQWCNELAYTQWTPAELASGEAWKHITRNL